MNSIDNRSDPMSNANVTAFKARPARPDIVAITRIAPMNKPIMLLTLLVSAAGAAGQNLVHNGGFEIPNPSNPSLPEGWGGFNTARYRTIGDNMGPILVRTGISSIELASGSDF